MPGVGAAAAHGIGIAHPKKAGLVYLAVRFGPDDLNSGSLPDALRQANAINEFGQITGYGYAPGGGLFHGFVLTPVPEPSSLVFGALVAAAAIRRFGRQR